MKDLSRKVRTHSSAATTTTWTMNTSFYFLTIPCSGCWFQNVRLRTYIINPPCKSVNESLHMKNYGLAKIKDGCHRPGYNVVVFKSRYSCKYLYTCIMIMMIWTEKCTRYMTRSKLLARGRSRPPAADVIFKVLSYRHV